MVICGLKPRIVEVSGFTLMTLGERSRISCADTMTAGRGMSASLPVGNPRLRSTTSPEMSMKLLRLFDRRRGTQFMTDSSLTQPANRIPQGFAEAEV